MSLLRLDFNVNLEETVFSFFDSVFIFSHDSGQLFLNGEIFHSEGKPYLKKFSKQINVKKFPKTLVWGPVHNKEYVCQLDRGIDGRLFWKIWNLAGYKEFRGKPLEVFSVLKSEQKVEVFFQDMLNPFKIVKNSPLGWYFE